MDRFSRRVTEVSAIQFGEEFDLAAAKKFSSSHDGEPLDDLDHFHYVANLIEYRVHGNLCALVDNGYRICFAGDWIIFGDQGECHILTASEFTGAFVPVEPGGSNVG